MVGVGLPPDSIDCELIFSLPHVQHPQTLSCVWDRHALVQGLAQTVPVPWAWARLKAATTKYTQLQCIWSIAQTQTLERTNSSCSNNRSNQILCEWEEINTGFFTCKCSFGWDDGLLCNWNVKKKQGTSNFVLHSQDSSKYLLKFGYDEQGSAMARPGYVKARQYY